jgi:hypothetical protein
VKDILNSQAGINKIEELCLSSNSILAKYETTIEQFKNKIITSYGEFDGSSISFSKDDQFLKENIDQVRKNVKAVLKEAKLETKGPAKGEEDFIFKTMKNLMVTDQLLEEISNSESKKNKIFVTCKEEFATLCNKGKSYLKDLNSQNEKLRGNNQTILGIVRDDTTKTPTSKGLQKKDSESHRLKYFF